MREDQELSSLQKGVSVQCTEGEGFPGRDGAQEDRRPAAAGTSVEAGGEDQEERTQSL